MKRFAKTGALFRFFLRRDRIRLPLWIAAIAGFTAGYVPLFEQVLMEDVDPSVFVSMMENPAMIALAGPVYGRADYHTGAAYANMMLVFCVIFAAIMNIFLVVRHTRADEEAGRAELLRARPVGAAAPLTATLLLSFLANGLLAVLTTVFLIFFEAQGMTAEGVWLFGAALGVVGWFFAGLTALLAQLSENTRIVRTGAFLLLLWFYLQRGIGDLFSETLSRLSPLGLILRTRLYVNNEWWPVGILLAGGCLLAGFTFLLSRKRDLGAGFFAARSGRREASVFLSSPFGLAFRQYRNTMGIWALIVFLVAAMYGSVFGEMESFVENNVILRQMFAADPDLDILEQFIGMLNAIMAILTAIPVVGAMHRLAGEEKSGYAAHLYGRAVYRRSYFLSWTVLSFGLSILLQTLTAVGFYYVGAEVVENIPPLTTFLISAYSYLPAIWLVGAVAAVLVALAPGLRAASYIYLGLSFVLVYIGSVARFPDWVAKLTPFGYVSNYPVEILKLLPLAVMTGIALILLVVSVIGYRQRDLKNG